MSSQCAVSRAVRCALLTSAAVAGVATVPAHAAEDQNISEVIVTGSRIPRANLTAPTAVTTINAEVIRQSGLNNVADILRAVPSFGVSALSSSNSNFLTASAGINTLQLRNLEEARTLVLVNGRRYVSGVPGEASVDFNTIPVALIDRVEIITGGASAVYGSDALAGVINVILKKNYEGLDIAYQFGEATSGGAIENRITLTGGSNFADGRGNAVVSATFNQNKGLLSRDRSNTRVDDLALCRTTLDKADCQIEQEPVFSSFAEGGRFFVPSTQQSFAIASGTGASAVVAPWSSTTFGFNRQQWRRYTVPTERYLVSTLMDYEVGPSVKSFFEGTFAQTRTASAYEPFPHSNSDLNIAGIPIDNPFIPAAIRDAVLAKGDTEVEYFRRATELGNRGAEATRNTYRFVAGFEGDFLDDYRWETFYAFGRMDDAQRGGGQVNVLNMREALNVEPDGEGGYRCVNEYARLEGCVPINLFGKGSISPEAADYVRAPTSRQMSTQQEVFGANLGGPVFELPAGPLSFALGGEWRRERSKDIPDVLTQAGLNAGNAEAPTVGGFDVAEGFVELEVPVLKDLPAVYDLTVGAAYRYSDYSTVGTTNAYAGRVSWSPIEPVRLRLQYARAVRAPNIGELFAPGGENFASVADPCGGITATTPGVVADNCRSIPSVAARIAATGSFTLSQTEIQGTGGFTGKGNSLLDAETSDSWSFGAVFDKNFGSSGDMTLSVDYFQIKINDLIDTVDRQSTVDFCYRSTTFPNQFCPFITRDSNGAALQQGELTEVNSGFVNEGTLETEGVDISFLYRRDLGPGQGAMRLNWTYLIDFTETKFGVEDNLVGETGYARNKAQMALVYSLGPWMGTWESNYIANSVPDKSNDLFNFSVGSYLLHDLQLAYDFAETGLLSRTPFDGTSLYLGINNVFDEDAPIILSGIPGNTTGTDTDASVYDPIGRTYYAGIRVSF